MATAAGNTRPPADPALREFEQRLRRSLAGVPRPDVDDIVDEIRSHVAEEIADGIAPARVVDGLGSPEEVAAEIVARRVRPEDGAAVASASRGRRIAAWIADVTLAWGPLVICPVWLALIGFVVEEFLMGPQELASLSEYGYLPMGVPWALIGVAVGLAAWGVWYWRVLRARSLSPGMRMAGISRIAVGGERLVVLTRDVAASEPALIVAAPKWYIALPVAPLAVIVAFAGLYYSTFAVGSFVQPWDTVTAMAEGREDFERADEVCTAFYDAAIAGDYDMACDLSDPAVHDDVAELLEYAAAYGLERVALGQTVDDGYIIHEYYGDGSSRQVVLSLSRSEVEPAPATFATVYRVSRIETMEEFEERAP